jgi:transcriptional regulator with XRE-family HTH domain|tara:strand:- start:7191 stop:7682 length:492 start_codon:yes stop_codon:yes gene_type:complete
MWTSQMVNEKKQHVALGSRIRKILDDSAISQRELSRKLKVGPNQVSRWVLGAVAPTYTVINEILKICRKQHLTNWVLTGKGESSSLNSDTPSGAAYDSPNDNPRQGEDEMLYRLKYETLLESSLAQLMTKDNMIIELQRQLLEATADAPLKKQGGLQTRKNLG